MYPVWRLTVHPSCMEGIEHKTASQKDLVHHNLSPETGLFSMWKPNSSFECSSLVTIMAALSSKITLTIKTINILEHTTEGREPYWDEKHAHGKSAQSVFTCTFPLIYAAIVVFKQVCTGKSTVQKLRLWVC